MELENNQKIAGGIIGIAGLFVIIALLIIPSFAGKDTQFFVTSTVNATNIALGDLTDVVLFNVQTNQFLKYNGTYWINANNTSGCTDLDCLTDVIISSPSSGQFLKYNGSKWVNVSVPIYENNTASNIGTFGTGLFAQKSGVDLQFKKLLASTGITITSNSTNVIITNVGVTSLTSDNNAISLSGSTGDITISPYWKKLCETTLGSANASIVCNVTAYKNYFIQTQIRTTSTGVSMRPAFNFNGDTGNNYAWISIFTGSGATTRTAFTGTSSNRSDITGTTVGISDGFISQCFIYNNQSADKKLVYCNTVGGLGGAVTVTPYKIESAGKWVNTSNQITKITINKHTTSGINFDTGSQLVVWGYD